MKSTRSNSLWRVAALLTLAGAPILTLTADKEGSPLAAYFGNTLLCQNQVSKAVCHLWLDADGSYFLMYDRGVQPDVPVPGGNFRLEGRRGSYRLRGAAGAYELCLQPDRVPGKVFAVERDGEAYAARACYALPERQTGQNWMQTMADGKTYKMWLVRGRG